MLLAPIALAQMNPIDTPPPEAAPTPRTLWRKRLAAVVALLLLLGAGGILWAKGQAEPWLRAAVDRRLAGSGFTLQWQAVQVAWTGSVTVTGLRLAEGTEPLLEVASATADIALLSSLVGRSRLHSLEVQAPHLHVDMMDGQPLAWLRLRKALQKPGQPPAERGSLAERLGQFRVVDGQFHATVLGKAVWFSGRDVDIGPIAVTLSAEGGELTAHLPPLLGGGQVTGKVAMRDGKPTQANATFDPPARYTAPELLRERLPKDLALQWSGARWDPQAGPAITGVQVLDLAQASTEILAIGAVQLSSAATLLAQDVRLTVPKARLDQAVKLLMPQGLPAEATTTYSAIDKVSALLPMVLAERRGDGWSVEIRNGSGRLSDASWTLARAQLVAGGQLEGKTRPLELIVVGPVLQVPRRSKLLRHPQLQDAVATGVTLRKVSVPQEELDDEPEEGDPEGGPPPVPAKAKEPAKAPVRSVAKAEVSERHPQRWTRQVKQAHAALLGLRKSLEARWFLHGWPAHAKLRIEGGGLTVLGDDGAALLGVRGGFLEVPGPQGPVAVAAEPFDRIGSWGRVALEWQREAVQKDHRVKLHLSGGGVAQLLGSRLPGASVGDGAELQLYADVALRGDRDVQVDGRLDMQRMGIQWWRLADRPIADFGMSLTFQAMAHPTAMVVRTPDIRLGQAWLLGSLEVVGLQGNPKVVLQVDAPMQDCGAMLASVPPSMIPTLGAVQAHGAMSWHVGLTVPLPQVGAASVELSLGDTPCVVDKLGDVDLTEFLKKDWVRPVNENGKILNDVLIGPGSGSWVPLHRMQSYTPYVMWASEDSFLQHRGISEALLGKAIAIDLSTGRFTYGGSTITQQLVKNLYLRRTKALSRKFEEMIIVWQMEKVLGKMKILEIYLNAVEFGPKVYGITRAAWEFFQKTPGELRPKEATYLAIIKPSPRSGYGTMRAGAWGDWYEMKCGKYLAKLHDEGIVSDEDFQRDFEEFGNWRPAWNPPARGAKQEGGKKGR